MLDHFVDHFLYHTKILHDVILGHTLRLLEHLEFPCGLIVVADNREDFFDGILNGVDLLESLLVFGHVLLVGVLVSPNLLLQLFLKLLALIVLSETLVLVLFDFSLDLLDLLVKLLSLRGQLTHEAGQSEVALLSFNKVTDKLIDVLGSSSFSNAGEGFLVFY